MINYLGLGHFKQVVIISNSIAPDFTTNRTMIHLQVLPNFSVAEILP